MPRENEQQNETENDQDNDDSKPITKGELRATLGNMVNGALTAHLRKPDFRNMLTTAIADAVKSALPAKEQVESDGDGAPAAGGAKSGKIDPKVAHLEKQLAEMKAQNEEKDRKAAEATERARMKEAEASLRTMLAGRVRPEAVNVVIDAFKARGAIQLGEDGAATMRLPYAATKGSKAELVDFDLEDGITEWMKSPEAALFAPPPNGGGSGAPPARGGRAPIVVRGKNPADMTPAERSASLEQNLARLTGQEVKTGFGNG